MTTFADDHRGMLPHDIADWNGGNRDFDNFPQRYGFSFLRPGAYIDGMHNCQAALTSIYSPKVHLNPLGALVAFGYVGSADLLYCQGFYRTQNYAYCDWTPSHWQALVTQSPVTGVSQIYAGVSNYFYLPLGSVPGGAALCGPNWATLRNVERYHTTNKASPMLLSCANGINNTINPTERYSHNLQGVSGWFYDGSGRWVDISEIDPDGVRRATIGFAHMHNVTGYLSSFQIWAREKLTLSRQ